MKKFIFIALATVTLGVSFASAAGYVSDNVKAASLPRDHTKTNRVDTEIHY